MEFSSFDIVKKLGIKRGSLHQYIDRGLIRPSIETASGQGTKNLFSLEDLYRIVFFLRLHEVGWDQKTASIISQGNFGAWTTPYQETSYWHPATPSHIDPDNLVLDFDNIDEMRYHITVWNLAGLFDFDMIGDLFDLVEVDEPWSEGVISVAEGFILPRGTLPSKSFEGFKAKDYILVNEAYIIPADQVHQYIEGHSTVSEDNSAVFIKKAFWFCNDIPTKELQKRASHFAVIDLQATKRHVDRTEDL